MVQVELHNDVGYFVPRYVRNIILFYHIVLQTNTHTASRINADTKTH